MPNKLSAYYNLTADPAECANSASRSPGRRGYAGEPPRCARSACFSGDRGPSEIRKAGGGDRKGPRPQRAGSRDRPTPQKWAQWRHAREDVFDQPLREAAREKSFDAVALSRMTGESRLVGEVMDTRSRPRASPR
jgi:hypothetical protein